MDLLNEYFNLHSPRFVNIIKLCLQSEVPQKIILFGTKSNGKTTLINIIQNCYPGLFNIEYDYTTEAVEKHTIYHLNELPISLGTNYHLFMFEHRYMDHPQYFAEVKSKHIDIDEYSSKFIELFTDT